MRNAILAVMLIAFTAAVAVQSAHPLLDDPAFLAAHQAWVGCTNRVVDAEYGSERSAEAIAEAALAACPAEQESTRRAVIAFSGGARGPEQMSILIDGSREGLIARVSERRGRAGASPGGAQPGVTQEFETASLAWARCTKNHLDASPSRARDGERIDAALAACIAEEAGARAATLRMLGDETRTERMMDEARQIARDSMRAYLRDQRR